MGGLFSQHSHYGPIGGVPGKKSFPNGTRQRNKIVMLNQISFQEHRILLLQQTLILNRSGALVKIQGITSAHRGSWIFDAWYLTNYRWIVSYSRRIIDFNLAQILTNTVLFLLICCYAWFRGLTFYFWLSSLRLDSFQRHQFLIKVRSIKSFSFIWLVALINNFSILFWGFLLLSQKLLVAYFAHILTSFRKVFWSYWILLHRHVKI